MKKGVPRAAISKSVLVILALVILISGSVGGYLVYNGMNNSTPTTQNTSEIAQGISQEAYTHWTYVAEKNLTSIYSQYSEEYQAVWFFFNDANSTPSLAGLNGKHDCNPAGGVDCSYNVRTAWQAFFNDTPTFASPIVCNYNITVELGERILVSAMVWFEASSTENASNSASAIKTIEVPYQIDFELVGGTYQLWKEYLGLPNEPMTLFSTTQVLPSSPGCSSD